MLVKVRRWKRLSVGAEDGLGTGAGSLREDVLREADGVGGRGRGW